jgi:hypothetical protein
MFDKAAEVAHKAADANPKDPDLKMVLAGALVEQGKSDEGLAMVKGHARRHGQGPGRVDAPEPVRCPAPPLEGCRRRPEQGGVAHYQERRPPRPALSCAANWPSARKHYEPAEQFFRQVLELDPSQTR